MNLFLLILCILSEGEKSVTNLEELLALRQSTVSQQLARLRLDGLVKTKRDGKTIYYNLANDDIRTILAALYEVFGKKQKRGARRKTLDRSATAWRRSCSGGSSQRHYRR